MSKSCFFTKLSILFSDLGTLRFTGIFDTRALVRDGFRFCRSCDEFLGCELGGGNVDVE